jgi:hypothetical protein
MCVWLRLSVRFRFGQTVAGVQNVRKWCAAGTSPAMMVRTPVFFAASILPCVCDGLMSLSDPENRSE